MDLYFIGNIAKQHGNIENLQLQSGAVPRSATVSLFVLIANNLMVSVSKLKSFPCTNQVTFVVVPLVAGTIVCLD